MTQRQRAGSELQAQPIRVPLPVDELEKNVVSNRCVWGIAGLLLVLGAASLAIDLPLAQFCAREACPRFLRELFAVAETFGNGLSVAIIVLAIWLLDPKGRIRIPRIVTAVLLAGLGADLVKLSLGRTRPRFFDLAEGHILESFGPLFPIHTIQSMGQGFPSAHTATAVAFAVMLAWAYPRGRWLFATLAVLVALQRVETRSHFLSDTFVGGAIGWVMGIKMLDAYACFGWNARIEAWMARRQSQKLAAESSAAGQLAENSLGTAQRRAA